MTSENNSDSSHEAADQLADVIASFAVERNPHGLSIPIDDAYALADRLMNSDVLKNIRAEVRSEALHDAFWAVHAGRFEAHASGRRNSFYFGTQSAKQAIERLHGRDISGPYVSQAAGSGRA